VAADGPSWIVFQPDIVVDAKAGMLWTVDAALAPLSAGLAAASPVAAVAFLLRRARGKSLLLDLVRTTLAAQAPAALPLIAEMFDRINAVYLAAVRGGPARAARG
jgi:hypothetical protein